MNCEVLQYGMPSILPNLSECIAGSLYRVAFPTPEQFDSGVNKQCNLAERRFYKKYRKNKKSTEPAGVFSGVSTTATGVFLLSNNPDKQESELWVYGKCTNWEFGLEIKEVALKVPLKLPMEKKEKVWLLSTSETHAAAVTEKENMYVWGKGVAKKEIPMPMKFQQAGFESFSSHPNSINYSCASVSSHTIYFVHNNTLYSHGHQLSGRLGLGQPFIRHTLSPVPVILPHNTAIIRGISCSDKFVMCWDSLGKLYSWGDGQYGRLGLGCRKGTYNYIEYKPTKVEALADVVVVTGCCGEDHGLAMTDQNQVYVWGKEYAEVIQYAKRPNKVLIPEKPVKICAKKHLSGVLTMEGHLYLWGESANILTLSDCPTRLPELEPYYISSFSLSAEFLVAISTAPPLSHPTPHNTSLHCPTEYKLYLPTKPQSASTKPPPVSFTFTPTSPSSLHRRSSQDQNIVYNNLRALQQIQNMHRSPDKPFGKLYWEKFIRDRPKRKPFKTISTKSIASSYQELGYVDPNYQRKMYMDAVDKFMTTKKKKKTVVPMSRKELDSCLQKLRVQNTRKPRVIIKTERPVLSVLPSQLSELVNRELLLRIFIHLTQTHHTETKIHNTNLIYNYFKGITNELEFQRKPRKMMCPDFAAIITQMAVVKKTKKTIFKRIQELNKSVRRIQGVFESYSKIAKLVKSHLSHLMDFMFLTHFKICKGSSLQRLVVQMRNESDGFRKVRITATRLISQAFNMQHLSSTLRRESITSQLPILPYSKHQFDVTVPEQNKFSLFNKNDRNVGEVKARRQLINLMLRANIRHFLNELREYDHSKQTFIYTHVDHIDKERARLLLMGKLPMNKNGEYLPFQSIKEKIASKMSTFPKRPDLVIGIMERVEDRWDSEKNNFKKIFKRYVELVKAYLQSKN